MYNKLVALVVLLLGISWIVTGCGFPLVSNNNPEGIDGSALLSEGVSLQGSSADFPIDETQAERSGPGPWNRVNSETCGSQGGMYWVSVNGNTVKNSMTWRAQLQSGQYAVLAFIPGCNATTRSARYRIRHAAGETIFTVNQNELLQVWTLLGVYNFGQQGTVVLGDDTGEDPKTTRKVGFDAIAWVPVTDRFSAPLASTPFITQPFGDGHCNNSGSYGHLGEDSRATGIEVLATANGIVTRSHTGCMEGNKHCNGGWGNAVILLHVLADRSLRYSLYGHLSGADQVRLHQIVRRGQTIGRAGNTGDSMAAHLHFEIKDANVYGAGYARTNFDGSSYRHNGITHYMPSEIAGYRINPPNAPSNLKATAASPTQINLTWTHDGVNARRFQVERSRNQNGPWQLILSCKVEGNVRTYEDKTVAPNTTYYYRVRAYDAVNDITGEAAGNASRYSNIASATTPKK